MKHRSVVLCLILSFFLLTGCSTAGSASVASDYMDAAQLEAVQNQLASYPDSYHEICKSQELVVQKQDGSILNQNLWDEFYQQVQEESPAELVIAHFTTEGDPILIYVSFDGSTFFYVYDTSRDAFGAQPYYQSGNYPQLIVIDQGTTDLYLLSEQAFDCFEDYQSYWQGDHETYPFQLLWIPKE